MLKIKLFLLGLTLVVLSCTSSSERANPLADGNECGCNLTKEQMIKKLPITAMGDSLVICKVGTTNIIGSGLGYITWLEALQSEFNGGEGQIYNCLINENFKRKFQKRKLHYQDKSLYIYYRFPVDVYDTINQKWLDLELETYVQRIYAENDSIVYGDVELFLKPPRQTNEAFESAMEAYESEVANQNQYGISRPIKRLFVSAINGDEKARETFLEIPIEFKDYFDSHKEMHAFYKLYADLLTEYDAFMSEGGEREYYDLTIFPYFKDPAKYAD